MAQKNKESKTLMSEEGAVAFCAQLSPSQRRVLASCIDGEIAAMGFPDGVRSGSDRFHEARRKAATEIRDREVDLDELGLQVMPSLDEGLEALDDATRNAAKARKRLIDRYADFLTEEVGDTATEEVQEEEVSV